MVSGNEEMAQHSALQDTVLNLMAEKNKIESEIMAFNEILRKNGVGMEEPLVDDEGYPRNDIDVYQVRLARNKIICLKNDHKAVMKSIEEGVHNLHQSAAPNHGNSMESCQTSIGEQNKVIPIIKVGSVSSGSPADVAGLKDGDLIVEIGTINANNFTSLGDVGKVIQHSVNGSVDFKVERDGRSLSLHVRPRPWAGQGILGCLLLPLENIER